MNEYIIELQNAKSILDKLAIGIDPVSGQQVDENTLRKNQVIDCLNLAASVLEKEIHAGADREIREGKAVYITELQKKRLQTYERCKVSEIADEINAVISENNTKKFRGTWINDWLEENGYLCRNASKDRVPSEKGKSIGISSEMNRSLKQNGKEYNVNYYSAEAQSFIYMHLDEILLFRYKGNTPIAINFHQRKITSEITIVDFIKDNPDKCFIVATGSYDYYSGKSSYKTLLVYKGRVKCIQKNDINAGSSNRSILLGINDAASAIKQPTDIVIITATPLGFNTPQSSNYDLCSSIMRNLHDKGCDITLSECFGRGDELTSFVNMFS